jgi:hypothetical protein
VTFFVYLPHSRRSSISAFESGPVFETLGLRIMAIVEKLVCAAYDTWVEPPDFKEYERAGAGDRRVKAKGGK